MTGDPVPRHTVLNAAVIRLAVGCLGKQSRVLQGPREAAEPGRHVGVPRYFVKPAGPAAELHRSAPGVEVMLTWRQANGRAACVGSAPQRYGSELLSAAPDALRREIKLLGAPGTEPYQWTVEQMIRLEVEHARHRLH